MSAKPLFTTAAITFLVGLAIAAFAAGPLAPDSAAASSRFPVAPPPGCAYVPGELLVEFRPGTATRDLSASVRSIGARVVRVLPDPANGDDGRLVLVSSDTMNTHALAAAFDGLAGVSATCPNYYRRIDAVLPDDPGLVAQWGLDHIQAAQAWDGPPAVTPVVVADIDTGVDFLHPDLADSMWMNPGEIAGNGLDDDGNGYVDDAYGIDTVNGDCTPMDDYGHGTHTSGIVAATAGNGIGVTGTAANAEIMALKFIDSGGWGTDAGAIECIDYVVHEKLDHGVNVVAINASWGFPKRSPLLREAVQRAGDAGIVFCASAGNSGSDNDRWPHYPSSYSCSNVIAVAATNASDRLTWWSCWGARTVDVAAPGSNVLSTVRRIPVRYWYGETGEAMYARHSGTSMAAPFVAGAVAACAGAFPAETLDERVARVLGSVDRRPELQGRCTTGGRLDLGAALGGTGAGDDTLPPVTQVLGSDDRWHDVTVSLSLWSSDGAGGSGVARTEWRIDGGAWKTGCEVRVRAKADTKMTHTVDYRSFDRAGNREPKKSCAVNIDTTSTADDDVPGVALPPSPIVGDAGYWVDDYDVYAVDLDAGESLRAVATGLPGSWPDLGLYASGVVSVNGVQSLASSDYAAAGSTLVACVEEPGTYFLAVSGWWPPAAYELSWEVVPAGVDVTAPFVSLKGAGLPYWFYGETPWVNHAKRLTLAAADDPLGSGVARIETSLDEGLTWTPGAFPVIPAPADHSNDGLHTIYFRAVDAAGNASLAESGVVAIDTQGPMTETWAPRKAVRRGARCWIRTRIDDVSDYIIGDLVIRSIDSGEVVATRSGRWFGTGRDWTLLKCDFPRGDYDVLLAGRTHDSAGNLWTSAVTHQMLRVR